MRRDHWLGDSPEQEGTARKEYIVIQTLGPEEADRQGNGRAANPYGALMKRQSRAGPRLPPAP